MTVQFNTGVIDLHRQDLKEVPRYRSAINFEGLRPFNKQECLKQLSELSSPPVVWVYQWADYIEQNRMGWTSEEGHFWLEAVEEFGRQLRHQENPDNRKFNLPAKAAARLCYMTAETLKTRSFDGRFDARRMLHLAAAVNAQEFHHVAGIAEMVIPLSFIVGRLELARFLFDGAMAKRAQRTRFEDGLAQRRWIEALDVYRRFVVPLLSIEDLHQLACEVQPKIRAAEWLELEDHHYVTPGGHWCAWALSMQKELFDLIHQWPDDLYEGRPSYVTDIYHTPQDLIFELAESSVMSDQMRRLNLRLRGDRDVRRWLAHTGVSELDYVGRSILRAQEKEEARDITEALSIVRAPQAVPVMLELLGRSRAPEPARAWLDENLSVATPELLRIAQLKTLQAETAREFLRSRRTAAIAACGDPAVEAEIAKIFGSEFSCPKMDGTNTPEWLQKELERSSKLKLPAWLEGFEFASLVIDGLAMNDEQVQKVVAAVMKSTPDKPHYLIEALRVNVPRGTFDLFVWGLYERWIAEGAPPRDKWTMLSVGLLGSDELALKLAAAIRVWPGQAQHQRAVYGLECLKAMGSDAALLQISSISQKLPFKALKARAAACMEAIAYKRGFTREELEDRIVPDLGLDAGGSCTFDFGPRQFQFRLSQELKPQVRDEGGKLLADLPKPTLKDDPEKSAQAVKNWKLTKAQVKEATKLQTMRLEAAMVSGRSWSVSDFESYLVNHPFMTHFAQRVLWRCVHDDGSATLFRVGDDRLYASLDERAVTIDDTAKVMLAHPLNVPEDEKKGWMQVFADYELTAPFPQLTRPVFTLTEEEKLEKEIDWFSDKEVLAVVLASTLEKSGWTRGFPEGGCFEEYFKAFPQAGVTAIVEFPGIIVGYLQDSDPQSIDSCYFLAGVFRPDFYPGRDPNLVLELGQVAPVVMSEVLRDLHTVIGKS